MEEAKTLKNVLLLILLFFCIHNLRGQANQKKNKINYGAMSQMHFSYAQSDSNITPYGFRLRRLDVKFWQNTTEKINWGLLLGFGDFRFQILELDINYKIKDFAQIRVGQFAPPAARSGAPVDNLFKVPTMTFIERAPISQQWSSKMNLHAYRTFGLQLHGKVINNKLYYAFMVGNPKGSSFFNASSKNTIHVNDENGISLWGRIEYEFMESFVAGAFYNTAQSNDGFIDIIRESMGTHVLLRKKNWTIMTEYISGRQHDTIETKFNGYFFDLAYRINKFEPAIRFDYFTPYKNKHDSYFVNTYTNYTIGINYYATNKIRLQLNYIFKTEQLEPQYDQINNNLAYLNFQFLL